MTTIAKVGGSLFDLPDLGARLRRWLATRTAPVVLVPGGGAAADVIRDWDRIHRLGEETAHWLALRMLQVNAHVLACLLPGAPVVSDPRLARSFAILDPLAFAVADESSDRHVPHSWNATSDSVAARVAIVAEANDLVLLKSVSWDGADWSLAARQGVVDECLPMLANQSPGLRIHVVNLRDPPSR